MTPPENPYTQDTPTQFTASTRRCANQTEPMPEPTEAAPPHPLKAAFQEILADFQALTELKTPPAKSQLLRLQGKVAGFCADLGEDPDKIPDVPDDVMLLIGPKELRLSAMMGVLLAIQSAIQPGIK